MINLPSTRKKRACACLIAHNQVDVSKTVTRVQCPIHQQQPCKLLTLRRNEFAPKKFHPLVKDFPGLVPNKRLNLDAPKEPWHSLSEMTVWEFVPKSTFVPPQASYTAKFEVPHSHYKQNASVFERYSPDKERRGKENEMSRGKDKEEEEVVERFFEKQRSPAIAQ